MPAPKKITPVVAAQLMRRRSEGASARALAREFDISNQAIGKFFRKEDAKRTAELERANQQTREGPHAKRQPPSRPFHSGDMREFASADERLAYYEARRLDGPPYSIWDSNAVRRGERTAAERKQRRRR